MPKRKATGTATRAKRAETYRYPDAEAPMRAEVGTQAEFRKKKPPARYRYDSSLSPALDWDGQNPAREQGEALIRGILEAGSLAEVKRAAAERWVRAANADGRYGEWRYAMARSMAEVTEALDANMNTA